MNEKILGALVEAGAIKKINIRAKGSTIYVEAYSGSQAITATTLKGKLKTWGTIDSAAKWVRSLGLGEMRLDVVSWQPEQRKLQI